jgi:hypothetical protein
LNRQSPSGWGTIPLNAEEKANDERRSVPNEIQLNHPVEVMKFTMYYDGRLPSAANDNRIEDKHRIRKLLHLQLLQLFRDHPALPKIPEVDGRDWAHWPEWRWPQWQSAAWSEDVTVEEIGDLHFVPVVRETLRLICELDILFLRAGEPGVMERGSRLDIDNRLLTLFDALAIPNGEKARNYAIADATLSRTSPIFCLLEDDCRITAINVRTDSLLAPAEGAHEDDVRLIIGVTLKANVATYANLSLIS